MTCQGRAGRTGPPQGMEQAQRKNPPGSRSNRAGIKEGTSVIVPVGGGQGQAAVAGATVLLPCLRAVASLGLVVRRWRAGSGAVGGGRAPAGPHRPCAAGQPPGFGERAAEQELDLRVGAAQLVAGPPGQGVMDGRVEPEQDALAFGHCGSVAAVTGTGCRC